MSDDMKRMEINHEDTKNTKIKSRKTFVLFVSPWLISRGVVHVASDTLKL